ncbi:arad-like aldolase/epimerase [Delitschia confertaspora ATCC 74209]|uniref:Arad-like aldolase/epimerase n=1 Tax=Delitschia confertaspora ATCC 74209 TaxID=1513339 RepID=A0A9P4K0M9_9PLEO|nr:arad-like aldolase/epimerase [Delitschia confertaspora ATCC 74209]
MSADYFPTRKMVGLESLWKGLITASHILHNHGVLDAYGHISVRSPDNASTFWMPRNVAPALLSSPDDLVEYSVANAEPVEKNAPRGYIERYIHSEIYKRFPTINSVVHSHDHDVLPYCISGVSLRAIIHTAGFLGSDTPVWDIASHYSSNSTHDLLVRDVSLGASLSAAFKPATSAGFLYSKVRSALPGAAPELSHDPDHLVVLMRGHGFTTVARGIEEAVYQAIYTKESARVQSTASQDRAAHTRYTIDGKWDMEHGGKMKSVKIKSEGDLKYLSEKEAHDTWESLRGTVDRPWGLWVREVEVNPLYKNNA